MSAARSGTSGESLAGTRSFDSGAAVKLPSIDDAGVPLARLIPHVVGLMLSSAGILVAAAVLAGFAIRIDQTVDGRGVLEPLRIWSVRPLESGTVRRVLVRSGDIVAPGQHLVDLDTFALAADLAEQQAARDAARVEAQRLESAATVGVKQPEALIAQADARVIHARAAVRERLVDLGLGSDVDSALAAYRPGVLTGVDLVVSDLRAAQADRRSYEAQRSFVSVDQLAHKRQLAQIRELDVKISATAERMRRLSINSPGAGVVLTERPERLIGTAVRPGDELLEVALLDTWRAVVLVQQRDVHKVRVGDLVKLDVQALRALDMPLLVGRVASVAEQSTDLSQVPVAGSPASIASPGAYRIEVLIDRSQLAHLGLDNFKRGYAVDGKIITRSGRIAFLLWQALREHAYSAF